MMTTTAAPESTTTKEA
ncbi:unnamed protein product, partial [Adineta steineri]